MCVFTTITLNSTPSNIKVCQPSSVPQEHVCGKHIWSCWAPTFTGPTCRVEGGWAAHLVAHGAQAHHLPAQLLQLSCHGRTAGRRSLRGRRALSDAGKLALQRLARAAQRRELGRGRGGGGCVRCGVGRGLGHGQARAHGGQLAGDVVGERRQRRRADLREPLP